MILTLYIIGLSYVNTASTSSYSVQYKRQIKHYVD